MNHIFLFLFLIFSINVRAEQFQLNIGVIAAENKPVEIKSKTLDGKVITRSVLIGQPVYLNDEISTNNDNKIQILLNDQTAFNMGPGSSIVLDKFTYDPDKANLSATIKKGAFKFVSGKISEMKKDAMKVSVPNSVISIRGTSVVGNVANDGSSTVVLLHGAIALQGLQGMAEISKSGWGSQVNSSGVVAPPAVIPPSVIKNITTAVEVKALNSSSNTSGSTNTASQTNDTKLDTSTTSTTTSSSVSYTLADTETTRVINNSWATDIYKKTQFDSGALNSFGTVAFSKTNIPLPCLTGYNCASSSAVIDYHNFSVNYQNNTIDNAYKISYTNLNGATGSISADSGFQAIKFDTYVPYDGQIINMPISNNSANTSPVTSSDGKVTLIGMNAMLGSVGTLAGFRKGNWANIDATIMGAQGQYLGASYIVANNEIVTDNATTTINNTLNAIPDDILGLASNLYDIKFPAGSWWPHPIEPGFYNSAQLLALQSQNLGTFTFTAKNDTPLSGQINPLALQCAYGDCSGASAKIDYHNIIVNYNNLTVANAYQLSYSGFGSGPNSSGVINANLPATPISLLLNGSAAGVIPLKIGTQYDQTNVTLVGMNLMLGSNGHGDGNIAQVDTTICRSPCNATPVAGDMFLGLSYRINGQHN